MALTGALLLVLVLVLRPMDIWPAFGKLHSLELFAALTAVGIAWEGTTGRRVSVASPQTRWLLAFLVWAYAVTVARHGAGAGLAASWAMTLGPIFMGLVMLGLRGLGRLRRMTGLLLIATTCVAAVAVHQGMQPRQCIEIHTVEDDPEGEWEPDGRECLGARLCETDGRPNVDYACERVGLFGTYSTMGRVRWRGQLDDPNEVAVLIGAVVPFLFLFGARPGRPDDPPGEPSGERSSLLVLALAALLGVLMWAMVYTQSRGGQLVLGVVILMIFVRRFGWWSVLGAAAVVVPIVLLSWRGGADAESSSAERAEILNEGLMMLKAHPLLGIGIGQFASENPMNMAAHNSYLLVSTELGIPGYLMWCGLVWMTVKIPVTIAFRPPEGLDPRLIRFAEALAASTIGMLVGVFFLSFVYKHIFFVWLGLSGALHGAVRQAHPDFEVRTTGRDVAGLSALAVVALVAVKVASMTVR